MKPSSRDRSASRRSALRDRILRSVALRSMHGASRPARSFTLRARDEKEDRESGPCKPDLLQLKRDLPVDSIANDLVPLHLRLEVLNVDRSDVLQRLRCLFDRFRGGILPALVGFGEHLDDFQNVGHFDLLSQRSFCQARTSHAKSRTHQTSRVAGQPVAIAPTILERMANALEVDSLSISFGETNVLQGLSFRVARATSLAIIGPNGCGKTVLFKALVGSIPYQGQIRWAPGVRIGYVPQKLDIERDLPI